ncbi:TauD/TfdA dioxygenase family protein [Actinomadura harenae]|uniref:TauD/TfdA family dioxygenase n=1 Tax=Actinomadura harenae TaxID=2483351 RepID=A0A3M2M4P1_9ACTN|nr:TauD/TfdA family dioxygenase [Actinomadura harenae]RMI42088.1 TauD/TfdA family dioxygenase [Actinomadura harenae]
MPPTAAASSFTLQRVAGHIGAVITGLDLTRPLPTPSVAELNRALCDHKALFFPGQHLDHHQHTTFARNFGPPTYRPAALHGPHPKGFPHILTVDPDAVDARYGRDFEERYRARWTSPTAGWHTDLTPYPNPPSICILRAATVTSHGGDTCWTNLAAAYQGLSGPLRELADTLTTEHRFFAGCHLSAADPEDRAVLTLNTDTLQIAHHPLVRVHPDTAERVLFVNPASTARILGLTPYESSALLELLYEQMIRPEYIARWRWSPGDVAMWDNRATAHLAATDLAPVDQPRTMYRIAVLGDLPVGVGGSTSQLIAGDPLGSPAT